MIYLMVGQREEVYKIRLGLEGNGIAEFSKAYEDIMEPNNSIRVQGKSQRCHF